jgi:hypothetical protein
MTKRASGMQIVTFDQPIGQGTLYHGTAVSKRGRRYKWCATFSGEPCAIFQEDKRTPRLPDGRCAYREIKAPPALAKAIRARVRKERRSA